MFGLADVANITREYAQKVSDAFGRLVKDRVEIYEVLPELSLTTAETSGLEIPVEGNYIVITDATDAATYVDVVMNDGDRNRKIRMRVGDELECPVRKVRLTWAAQSGKSITIAFGKFLPGVFRFRRNAVQSIDTVSTVSTVATVAAVTDLTALPSGYARLTAASANPYIFYDSDLGDATGSAADYTHHTVPGGKTAKCYGLMYAFRPDASSLLFTYKIADELVFSHHPTNGLAYFGFVPFNPPITVAAGGTFKARKGSTNSTCTFFPIIAQTS